MKDPTLQLRLIWKDDPRRIGWRRKTAEWFFLLVGLAALDIFVWVNTSTILYQAYEDWSFDEALRGLKPSIDGFVADEIYWMFGGRTRLEKPELPQKFQSKKTPTAPPQRTLLPQMLLGRLTIPRLRVAAMVREGADSATLRRAVGHIPGTALPGQAGNVALAGHRDTFFRALRKIEKDDTIEFETETGTYRYVVQSTKIVSPRDVAVLRASGGKMLTLVTCYPFYYVGSAPKRFIVQAQQAGPTSPRQQASLSQDLRGANLQRQPRPGS